MKCRKICLENLRDCEIPDRGDSGSGHSDNGDVETVLTAVSGADGQWHHRDE